MNILGLGLYVKSYNLHYHHDLSLFRIEAKVVPYKRCRLDLVTISYKYTDPRFLTSSLSSYPSPKQKQLFTLTFEDSYS
jgi:hypothetical protein